MPLRSQSGKAAIAIFILAVVAGGCAGSLGGEGGGDDALTIFSSSETSIQRACSQVYRLCKRGGHIACLAYDLACGETEAESCSKLDLACESMLRACALEDQYCPPSVPDVDAGAPALDAPAAVPDQETIVDSAQVAPDAGGVNESDAPVVTGKCFERPGIFTSAAEISKLPTSGSAWETLLEHANRSASSIDLSVETMHGDIYALAKALVWARTNASRYRTEAIEAINKARLSAAGLTCSGGGCAMGWNLAAVVMAADLVQLSGADEQAFRQFLQDKLDYLITFQKRRPNNHGTLTGASAAAAARYLGDAARLADIVKVFKGYLGDRSAYSGFKYGSDLSWQCDESKPVGINPPGCMKNGVNLGGVIPDDMRRIGSFPDDYPNPGGKDTNPGSIQYNYGALQGSTLTAHILCRAGFDAWAWSDSALYRAQQFLIDEIDYLPDGDDVQVPIMINHWYGASFPMPSGSRGKNYAFVDWLFSL